MTVGEGLRRTASACGCSTGLTTSAWTCLAATRLRQPLPLPQLRRHLLQHRHCCRRRRRRRLVHHRGLLPPRRRLELIGRQPSQPRWQPTLDPRRLDQYPTSRRQLKLASTLPTLTTAGNRRASVTTAIWYDVTNAPFTIAPRPPATSLSTATHCYSRDAMRCTACKNHTLVWKPKKCGRCGHHLHMLTCLHALYYPTQVPGCTSCSSCHTPCQCHAGWTTNAVSLLCVCVCACVCVCVCVCGTRPYETARGRCWEWCHL